MAKICRITLTVHSIQFYCSQGTQQTTFRANRPRTAPNALIKSKLLKLKCQEFGLIKLYSSYSEIRSLSIIDYFVLLTNSGVSNFITF